MKKRILATLVAGTMSVMMMAGMASANDGLSKQSPVVPEKKPVPTKTVDTKKSPVTGENGAATAAGALAVAMAAIAAASMKKSREM